MLDDVVVAADTVELGAAGAERLDDVSNICFRCAGTGGVLGAVDDDPPAALPSFFSSSTTKG